MPVPSVGMTLDCGPGGSQLVARQMPRSIRVIRKKKLAAINERTPCKGVRNSCEILVVPSVTDASLICSTNDSLGYEKALRLVCKDHPTFQDRRKNDHT